MAIMIKAVDDGNENTHFFPPATMPRTKASARKSTGGTSVRKSLKANSNAGSIGKDIAMSSPPPSPAELTKTENTNCSVRHFYSFLQLIIEPSPQWCYSCVDGGLLIICDKCSRTMCYKTCLELPCLVEQVKPYIFICPTCHNDYHRAKGRTPQPYYVCSSQMFC
jgi:hypothetical protein